MHVDAGTQNLGGAVSNALRGRVPVLVFAGAAPFTQEGELPGSRNEFIHWIQDVPGPARHPARLRQVRQRGPHGSNVKQLVHRALQIARSEPPARCTWSARAR